MADLKRLFEAVVSVAIEDGFNIGTKMFLEELNQDLEIKEKLYEQTEDEIVAKLFEGTVAEGISEREDVELTEENIVYLLKEMRKAKQL